MTATGWAALAGMVAVLGGASGAPARAGVLVAAGRLAAPPARSLGLRRWVPVLHSGPGGAAPVVAAPVVAAAPVALVLVVGGPALAVAAAAVIGAAWLLARDALTARALAARRRQLLIALRVLVGELEAGARAAPALAAAAAVAPGYAQVFGDAAAAASGAHDAAAVLAADPDTRVLGLAWQLGEDTGAALAGVLGRVAGELSDAHDHRRTVATALAGPRASGGLLTALPLLGIALGTAMGAHPVGFLLAPGPGRLVCCVGVLLDVGGVLWLRRILARAERA